MSGNCWSSFYGSCLSHFPPISYVIYQKECIQLPLYLLTFLISNIVSKGRRSDLSAEDLQHIPAQCAVWVNTVRQFNRVGSVPARLLRLTFLARCSWWTTSGALSKCCGCSFRCWIFIQHNMSLGTVHLLLWPEQSYVWTSRPKITNSRAEL